MKQEDKQLLLQDLCSRLPYKVMIQSVGENKCLGLMDLVDIDSLPKPYLRTMSSMTEEERKEYKGFIVHREHVNAQGQEWDIDCFCFGSVSRLIDWLNAHHFDYRALIEKGLAIEVTEENNPYK